MKKQWREREKVGGQSPIQTYIYEYKCENIHYKEYFFGLIKAACNKMQILNAKKNSTSQFMNKIKRTLEREREREENFSTINE